MSDRMFKRMYHWVLDWFLFRVWNPIHGLLLRLRLVSCLYCNNTGSGCNCGVDGVSYEISGGLHYEWCMEYKGCPNCGRTMK